MSRPLGTRNPVLSPAPARVLTDPERAAMLADVALLVAADLAYLRPANAPEYDAVLEAVMARADAGGWRRHLLVELARALSGSECAWYA